MSDGTCKPENVVKHCIIKIYIYSAMTMKQEITKKSTEKLWSEHIKKNKQHIVTHINGLHFVEL